MPLYQTFVFRDDVEIPIDVTYNISKGCLGARDKYGAQLEPDEPPSIEIDRAVNTLTKEEIELTDEERMSIQSSIWDNQSE